MSYESVLTSLTKERTRYLVVGGVAVLYHGYQRFTADLDIVPDLERDNLEKIINVMRMNGYVPRVSVAPTALLDPNQRKEWREEKGMKVFTYLHPQEPLQDVDFLIFNPLPFHEAFERRKEVLVSGIPVYIASLDDILYMKRQAGIAKDLYDIKILEEIKEQKEDEPK